jgi:hypothetical protein
LLLRNSAAATIHDFSSLNRRPGPLSLIERHLTMGGRIARILSERHRRGNRVPGACAEEIERLREASPYPVPEELVELLQFSNGGEGDLGLPPRLLMLDDIADIVAGLRDPFLLENFPGFVFFGGNGGLERLALDCRSG